MREKLPCVLQWPGDSETLSCECSHQEACVLTLQSWSAVVRVRAIKVQLQALPLERIISLNAAFNHPGRLQLTSALPTMSQHPS